MNTNLEFQNHIEIVLRSGDTGEVLDERQQHNDISDDMLAMSHYIYMANSRSQAYPYCFLLKDGPDWTGFSWDRRNPWAPYCYTLNNYYNGVWDATANPHWAAKSWSFVGNRHRLFYKWTQLADDLVLRALGLTGWDHQVPQFPQSCGIVTGMAGVFQPQSLITLANPLTVRGRKGGTQVPDILEVSYYLSAVGVN